VYNLKGCKALIFLLQTPISSSNGPETSGIRDRSRSPALRRFIDSSQIPLHRSIPHQWCYGRLPLHATHRFITQVKQKNNAEIIRSEIAVIQGKFDAVRKKAHDALHPCPFTAFLLATNWSSILKILTHHTLVEFLSAISACLPIWAAERSEFYIYNIESDGLTH